MTGEGTVTVAWEKYFKMKQVNDVYVNQIPLQNLNKSECNPQNIFNNGKALRTYEWDVIDNKLDNKYLGSATRQKK